MPELTPSYLMDFESRMQFVTSNEYGRLTQNLWWTGVAKTRTTQARRELLTWLLSTAMIRDQGEGGNIAFEELVAQTTEMETRWSGDGLKLRREQIEDVDGNGPNLASEWSAQIAAQMAYWPQIQTAHFLMNAHDIAQYKAYDGKAFFATNHTLNPYRTGGATFANLFTGAPSGSYPGALPIDESVSADVALANLQKLYGAISGIKMPNGKQPRYLRPRYLIVPPALTFRAVQLTQAKFLAQAAAGGGAAPADVTAIIQALGLALPVQADELAGFENDKTYFVACEQITADQLGGVIYLEREAYKINYYGPQTDAELNRKDELEWHCKGRNAIVPGHPFLLFKVKGV
jgi:phage major head subunit gpT-like protein